MAFVYYNIMRTTPGIMKGTKVQTLGAVAYACVQDYACQLIENLKLAHAGGGAGDGSRRTETRTPRVARVPVFAKRVD